MNKQSPYQFSFFRIILGTYLAIHFLDLLSHAHEVWGPNGLIADPTLNLTHGVVPNILLAFPTDGFVTGFLIVLAILSAAFAVGVFRPVVSIILWYGWVCLFDRNNLIANPGLPFIGWLLLVCAVVPRGEPLALFSKAKSEWSVPKWLWVGAWVIMAVSYSISGIDKLMAPSWRDGTAIFHLLENPLARPTMLREWLVTWPHWTFNIMTWSILGLELLFAPLCLHRKTRKWAWVLMIFMHLGILTLVDFADLTIGMLMIHLFTFDARWLPGRKPRERRVLFFDGVCGLCNSSVDFFMQEDRDHVMKHAPLQGDTARELIPEFGDKPMDTLVLYDDGKVYTESTAVLRVIGAVGGIWRLGRILIIIPTSLRNAVYRWISRNRYKWFGKKESCRMPTPEERERLLW